MYNYTIRANELYSTTFSKLLSTLLHAYMSSSFEQLSEGRGVKKLHMQRSAGARMQTMLAQIAQYHLVCGTREGSTWVAAR